MYVSLIFLDNINLQSYLYMFKLQFNNLENPYSRFKKFSVKKYKRDFMSVNSREYLFKNLSKEDLKEINKDLEKEIGIGNFCYIPKVDLAVEDFFIPIREHKG